MAESSPDQNVHRMDEPYRRALTGVYARLAATLKELTGTEAARHAVAPAKPLCPRRGICCRAAHDRSLAQGQPRLEP